MKSGIAGWPSKLFVSMITSIQLDYCHIEALHHGSPGTRLLEACALVALGCQ